MKALNLKEPCHAERDVIPSSSSSSLCSVVLAWTTARHCSTAPPCVYVWFVSTSFQDVCEYGHNAPSDWTQMILQTGGCESKLNFLNAAVPDAIKKKSVAALHLVHFIFFTSLSLMLQSHAEFFYFHSPNELVCRIPARRRIQVSKREESKRRDAAEHAYGAISAPSPPLPPPPPPQKQNMLCTVMHRQRQKTRNRHFFIAGGKTCCNNSSCSFQRRSSAVSPLRKKKGQTEPNGFSFSPNGW